MTSLSDWTRGRIPGNAAQLSCQEQRLDELVQSEGLPRPDFIKCDVEGAELLVFKGAKGLLDSRDAPIIVFEANVHTARGFGVDVAAATQFLADLQAPRYTFFEVDDTGRMSQIESPQSEHANILAVPEGRMDRLPEPLEV